MNVCINYSLILTQQTTPLFLKLRLTLKTFGFITLKDSTQREKNVLDNKSVVVISGEGNYYPFHPDNDSIEAIDSLLSAFKEDESYYHVSLRIIKIFWHMLYRALISKLARSYLFRFSVVKKSFSTRSFNCVQRKKCGTRHQCIASFQRLEPWRIVPEVGCFDYVPIPW